MITVNCQRPGPHAIWWSAPHISSLSRGPPHALFHYLLAPRPPASRPQHRCQQIHVSALFTPGTSMTQFLRGTRVVVSRSWSRQGLRRVKAFHVKGGNNEKQQNLHFAFVAIYLIMNAFSRNFTFKTAVLKCNCKIVYLRFIPAQESFFPFSLLRFFDFVCTLGSPESSFCRHLENGNYCPGQTPTELSATRSLQKFSLLFSVSKVLETPQNLFIAFNFYVV